MALDDPLDEHEQSERVLAWLRANGLGLIGGLVLGLAAISGWKWWQQDQHHQNLGQADQYQAAVAAVQAGDETATAKVESLGDGVYGDLAALQLAASQVELGQSDAAIATLRAVQPGEPAMADIVDQRLARLLIDAGQADEALELLADASSPTALEAQGDAQYALGQSDKAREAYGEALVGLDVASPQRQILELKLTQVGGAVANREPVGPGSANTGSTSPASTLPESANAEAQS